MKDFSNASFSPDTIGIMNDAMDAAVARYPTRSVLRMWSFWRKPFSAPPRMVKETRLRCSEWHC
jgi:hypothetical protein